MASLREPHRDGHLALIARMEGEGRLLMAGAIGDPPHGAAIGFSDREAAEEFVAADPYGAAGLVTDSAIEPWTVVAGLGT
jgi:uncharacterized protein YciI